jgi:hypothetical protein
VPGGLAVALLAFGAWRSWTGLIPFSVALVGGGWAASLLFEDAGVDGAAPLIAAGLLLATELAYWATAARAVPVDAALMRRQLLTVLAVCGVSLCLGTLLLLVGGASVRGGLPLEAVGVAAAIAALAVVARLARS